MGPDDGLVALAGQLAVLVRLGYQFFARSVEASDFPFPVRLGVREPPPAAPYVLEHGVITDALDLRIAGDLRISEDLRISVDLRIAGDPRIAVNPRIAVDLRIAEDLRISEDPRITVDLRISEDPRIAVDLRIAGDPRISFFRNFAILPTALRD